MPEFNDNKGFVLITFMLISTLLLLLGISAIKLSNNRSMIIKNKKNFLTDFYAVEEAIDYALYNSDLWLTDTFITEGTEYAKAVFNPPESTVKLEIRYIDNIKKTVKGLSTYANDLPIQPHISPPLPGSGFGIKNFEIRKYGITATSNKGIKIQVGVWKIFNK